MYGLNLRIHVASRTLHSLACWMQPVTFDYLHYVLYCASHCLSNFGDCAYVYGALHYVEYYLAACQHFAFYQHLAAHQHLAAQQHLAACNANPCDQINQATTHSDVTCNNPCDQVNQATTQSSAGNECPNQMNQEISTDEQQSFTVWFSNDDHSNQQFCMDWLGRLDRMSLTNANLEDRVLRDIHDYILGECSISIVSRQCSLDNTSRQCSLDTISRNQSN